MQDEGIPLQSHELSKEQRAGSDWKSVVKVSKTQTVIRFRRRKNKSSESLVIRSCTCDITPYACGKCALDKQVEISRELGSELVFPNVRSKDINILREIALEHGMPYPTWHGFRRWRPCDLVSRHLGGEPISLIEIFESGGWATGSRAIMQYLSREHVDKERIIQQFAELSESD